ncbi:MAG: hypothetical protein QOC67_5602 [Pseudonocardiales bacterium]|nr:hypothetical protein [Pseudonocardiales bacterium]
MTFDPRSARDRADLGTRPRPRAPAPRGVEPPPPTWPEATVPSRSPRSFTTSKVLAGGLAAATSAVLGSYLGVFGTVGGAAAGAVATAVSTEVYQRSIERTTDRVRSRVGGQPRGRQPQAARTATGNRRRAWPRLLVWTVVIFALGIGVVSGVERLKGGPLSGGTEGTSLGRVLPINLEPVVGGLLGSSDQGSSKQSDHPDDSGSGSGERRDPGLVGGLVTGLTGH